MPTPSSLISRAQKAAPHPAPAPAPIHIPADRRAVPQNLTPRSVYKEIMEKYDRMSQRHISR